MHDLVWILIPLLAVLCVPWAVGLTAALGQGVVQRHLLSRSRTLGAPARRWLEAFASRQGLSTRVEVHAALAEAYFPHADTVGLSPAAARSAHPVHRAVVAHELGHAATTARSPLLRGLLPAARLATDGLPFGVGAAFLVAVLHDSSTMLGLGLALLVLTVLSHGIVLVDEATASLRAWRWLRDDRELSPEDRDAVATSFLAALSAYAAPFLAWGALLLATPWLASLTLSGSGLPPAEPLDATGTWLLLLLGPALLLHAGLVLTETVRPEPVRSAFQLELRQQRVHQWGFTAGICALLVALGVAAWGEGPVFELAVALAVFTGLEPATVLLRAALLVPVLVLARLVGLGDALDAAFPTTDASGDAPAALAALWEHPPWFLRAARLTQLAWAPLVLFVVLQSVARVG